MPIRNLMAKPSMYNYVGVGGLQGHAALRIVCVAFVHKIITVVMSHESEGHVITP